jgi:hypothetical protein
MTPWYGSKHVNVLCASLVTVFWQGARRQTLANTHVQLLGSGPIARPSFGSLPLLTTTTPTFRFCPQ